MRKLLPALVLTSTFLLLATPVLAVESSNPVKERLEQVREKLDLRKEVQASKAAVRKANFEQFKDRKKAAAAERLVAEFNKLNQTRTEAMSKRLTMMSQILTKIETKVSEDTETSKKAEIDAALTKAKNSVKTAETAVATQKAKEYTLTSTTESTIRTEAQTTKNKLRTDLDAVNKLIITAKQDIAAAIRVIATSRGDK